MSAPAFCHQIINCHMFSPAGFSISIITPSVIVAIQEDIMTVGAVVIMAAEIFSLVFRGAGQFFSSPSLFTTTSQIDAENTQANKPLGSSAKGHCTRRRHKRGDIKYETLAYFINPSTNGFGSSACYLGAI